MKILENSWFISNFLLNCYFVVESLLDESSKISIKIYLMENWRKKKNYLAFFMKMFFSDIAYQKFLHMMCYKKSNNLGCQSKTWKKSIKKGSIVEILSKILFDYLVYSHVEKTIQQCPIKHFKIKCWPIYQFFIYYYKKLKSNIVRFLKNYYMNFKIENVAKISWNKHGADIMIS